MFIGDIGGKCNAVLEMIKSIVKDMNDGVFARDTNANV